MKKRWLLRFGHALHVQVVVNGFHLPPYLTAEIDVSTNNNFMMMRMETFVACFSTLRLYLLVRMVMDGILSHMPKRHTISTYAGVELGAAFAFKRLFNGWNGVVCVAGLWALLLMVLACWYRAAENTACFLPTTREPRCLGENARMWTSNGVSFFEKTNDLYFPNAMWMMYITSTTGACAACSSWLVFLSVSHMRSL